MTEPKSTTWKFERRTKAKHAILDAYLKAWFPILGKTHDEVVFVDGFCGPGTYKEGEVGSPFIALDAAKASLQYVRGKATFWFIDVDHERIQFLNQKLGDVPTPPNFQIVTRCGSFAETFETELARLESKRIPAFVFIDPFGFKDVPYEMVSWILAIPSAEVFVNVMVGFMNRFLQHPDEQVQSHIVDFFGTEACLEIAHSSEPRVEALRNLYRSQLKRKAQFVRFFQMLDTKKQPVYDLFFATNNRLGHAKMKEAMWKVDAEQGFRFSDAEDPKQSVLFANDEAWMPVIQRKIRTSFGDREQVPVEEIRRYIEDKTAYRVKHMNKALTDMEKGRRVRVESVKRDGSKRISGTFPDGTVLSFRGAQEDLF